MSYRSRLDDNLQDLARSFVRAMIPLCGLVAMPRVLLGFVSVGGNEDGRWDICLWVIDLVILGLLLKSVSRHEQKPSAWSLTTLAGTMLSGAAHSYLAFTHPSGWGWQGPVMSSAAFVCCAGASLSLSWLGWCECQRCLDAAARSKPGDAGSRLL
jgi:hypothetical protein